MGETTRLETGTIPIEALDGPFDLQSTLESGQTYLWTRPDERMFETDQPHGGNAWYETVVPPLEGLTQSRAVVRVRQLGDPDTGRLEWESTTDAVPLLRHLLRLDDDLDQILDATPDLPLLSRAYRRYRGMRLVRDPAFPCLISFICSAQMRVGRIHDMQRALAREYGEAVAIGDRLLHAYPTPDVLAARTESDLRDLSLGYRAPYVQRSAEMVATGKAHPAAAKDLPYRDAREYLTQFVGVGPKVADCVLLFSLGFLQAVPLDTWIQTALDEYFPECHKDGYAETSRAIRRKFGGEYAGYAQTYVFYYLRSGGE